MTMFLRNSTFIHVPKTGGTWMRECLSRICLERTERSHLTPEKLQKHPMFQRRSGRMFCCARNPVSWYRSYWGHRANGEWSHEYDYPETSREDYGEIIQAQEELDSVCKSDNASDFMLKVSKNFPGWLTRFHAMYASECKHVLRLESIEVDLFTVMLEFKENVSKIRIVAPVNTMRDSVKKHATPSSKAISAIMESESEYCEKYGYS